MGTKAALCLAVSLAWLFAATAAAQSNLSVSPASLSFTFQIGGKVPPAAAVAVKASTGVLPVTISTGGAGWLSVTPGTAATPASIRVAVDPSGLAPGTYTDVISFASAAAGNSPQTVAVSLLVKAAAANLTIAPLALSFTHQAGDPAPAAQTIAVSSNASLLSFAAAASGAAWLSVSPSGGLAFATMPTHLNVSVNPAGLAPGNYKGTVVITCTGCAAKLPPVTVTLSVTAPVPVLASVTPNQIDAGAADTAITLAGTGFFKTTAVKVNGAAVPTTYFGPASLMAVIPAKTLAAAGTLQVTVTTPAPGGGTSAAVAVTVLVRKPRTTPAGIVNAASFISGAVAPGEIITIFGANLGPDTLMPYSLTPAGLVDTTLANTQVTFDGTPAPLLYVQANQLSAIVPYNVAGKSTTQLQITANGQTSDPLPPLDVATAAPGIFTLDSSGSGQAAAINQDGTINSSSAPAARGSTIMLYATGEGQTNPAGVDGALAGLAAPWPAPVQTVTAEIGGVAATVAYAGAAPGSVSGIMQVNVTIPNTVTPGNSVPVVIKIGGTLSSQANATIAVQ